MSKNITDADLLSSYAGLLSLATLSVYIGAQASIPVLIDDGRRPVFLLHARVSNVMSLRLLLWMMLLLLHESLCSALPRLSITRRGVRNCLLLEY